MGTYDVDVLIVGGGPVGLTLASNLDMHGVEFEVIDAMPHVLEWAKAHGLNGRALEALDLVGLAEPVLAAAQFPEPRGTQYKDGKLVQYFANDRLLREPLPYGAFMPQHDTEVALETELERRGHKVQRNTRLVSFEQDDEGVTAVIETALDGTLGMFKAFLSGHGDMDGPDVNEDTPTSQRTVRARWMVAADGAHSAVRKTLGLTMDGDTLPLDRYFGECKIEWTHPKDLVFSSTSDKGGVLKSVAAVYTPFDDTWHVTFGGAIEFSERPTLEEMQEVFREVSGMPDVVLHSPKFIERLPSVNFRMPEHIVINRVVLAGDAAHARSALGGTGMNSGIVDALNLGWKLALDVKGAAAPGLLQTYEDEQMAEARRLEDQVKSATLGNPKGGNAANMAKRIKVMRLQTELKTPLTDKSLRGRVEYYRGRAQTKIELTRRKTRMALDESLKNLVLPYGHAVSRDRSMMDVTYAASTLTHDDPPPPPPPKPGVLDALLDRDKRKEFAKERAKEWLIRRHPVFEAVFTTPELHAGEFVPDAVCRVGFRPTRVRHLIRGPKAQLWLFCGDEPTAEVVRTMEALADVARGLEEYVNVLYVFPSEGWADRHGHPYTDPNVMVDGQFQVRHALQIEGPHVVYIRPDGPIGLRTRNLDVRNLRNYLRRIYKAELVG